MEPNTFRELLSRLLYGIPVRVSSSLFTLLLTHRAYTVECGLPGYSKLPLGILIRNTFRIFSIVLVVESRRCFFLNFEIIGTPYRSFYYPGSNSPDIYKSPRTRRKYRTRYKKRPNASREGPRWFSRGKTQMQILPCKRCRQPLLEKKYKTFEMFSLL